MTHRDSDVLGRYVGTPAAPVQGEEAKAGEHTALPWTPAKFHWMGRACDDLSRDELMDIIQYLHRQLEATREESHRSIDFILSARKAREQ